LGIWGFERGKREREGWVGMGWGLEGFEIDLTVVVELSTKIPCFHHFLIQGYAWLEKQKQEKSPPRK
jgi:hypothetical protein